MLPSPQALAVGFKLPPATFTFDHSNCILYALGVGMSTKDPDHLRYVEVYVCVQGCPHGFVTWCEI